MQTPEAARSEIDSLRKAMRDLVAMTTLPVVWGELAPGGVIESLAGVLLKTLDLELALRRRVGDRIKILEHAPELRELGRLRTRQEQEKIDVRMSGPWMGERSEEHMRDPSRDLGARPRGGS